MMLKESKLYQPTGNLYNVNGYDIHLYGTGKGDITVVFISGSGTPCTYTDFYELQNELQQYARTVSYDYAGYGWSERMDKARTVDILVDELHQLLASAGESPPYILVAHSLGSLEAIRYAQIYPNEVKSIVLLDGGNPYFYAQDSEASAIITNRLTALMRTTGIIRALGELGILLPFGGENTRYNMLPDDIKDLDKSMYYNKIGNPSNISFIKEMNENADTVIKNGYLTDIPLYILSSDSGKNWTDSQKQLAEWSNISSQETIPGANHYIYWTNKDIVIEKIMELIYN